MIDLEKIDKKVWGWGVRLDDVERKELLGHMLWECMSPDEFRQKCAFIFNGPMILLQWERNKRSVFIVCDDKRNIFVSI